MKRIHIDIPNLQSKEGNLFQVLESLRSAGGLAWIAGGAVRDALLRRPYHDIDVVTDLSVEQLSHLFPQAIMVGAQFGVLRVRVGDEEFEIAQFRQESDYKDGRRPSLVSSGTPEQDAKRRDLTVNALFYDPLAGEVYDYVQGLEDLRGSCLRAVGDAEARLREDHLRILRAWRFSIQLGFDLEPQLLQALRSRLPDVSKVSRERVREELMKMVTASRFAQDLPKLFSEGLFQQIIPGWSWPQLPMEIDGQVWCENPWGALALQGWRGGTKLEDLSRGLRELKLSRAEQMQAQEFSFWLMNENSLLSERDGVLLERLFERSSIEGLQFSLPHLQTFRPRAQKLLDLRRSFRDRPAPRLKSTDFPHLQGPRLGEALKKAYWLQLENPDLDAHLLLEQLAGQI